MSSETEYYDILGLKKEDKPTADAIRRAYKSMARKYHPDLNPDADPTLVCRLNNSPVVIQNIQMNYVTYSNELFKMNY